MKRVAVQVKCPLQKTNGKIFSSEKLRGKISPKKRGKALKFFTSMQSYFWSPLQLDFRCKNFQNFSFLHHLQKKEKIFRKFRDQLYGKRTQFYVLVKKLELQHEPIFYRYPILRPSGIAYQCCRPLFRAHLKKYLNCNLKDTGKFQFIYCEKFW